MWKVQLFVCYSFSQIEFVYNKDQTTFNVIDEDIQIFHKLIVSTIKS